MDESHVASQTWRLTPDPLCILDRQGCFAAVNPAWKATLGWSETEMIGVPYLSFLHPDDVGRSMAAFEEVKSGKPVFRFENRYRARDGSFRWFSWVAVPEGDFFYCTVRDVTDLDEAAYKDGRVDTRLTGSLRVPLSPAMQGGKCATTTETPLEPLVEQVLEDWDIEAAYLVGAGSVCQAVKKQFWGEPTLLGVDAIVGDRIVETDLNGPAVEAFVAAQQAAGRRVKILLSTIGGQGMLLGRGTQVFTPAALAQVGWSGIHVVAPPEKLIGLRGLHVDSGDADFDAAAPKHIRVTAGWHETRMIRVLHGASEA